jgi:quercetin dioxygenase-like cupin family protein
MENRRTFLGLAMASLMPIALDAEAVAQTAATPRGPRELARHALTGPFDGWDVVLVELNMPPGQRPAATGHRHPGAVLGYVVDGQVSFGVNHQPAETIPTGGTFFESTGTLHTTNGSASSAAPARAVVFMLVPKGSPLTLPE